MLLQKLERESEKPTTLVVGFSKVKRFFNEHNVYYATQIKEEGVMQKEHKLSQAMADAVYFLEKYRSKGVDSAIKILRGESDFRSELKELDKYMKMKIGQEVIISEDFEIVGFFSEDTISVKKGDKGYIDSNKFIHYETGNARGKMHRFSDAELDGYDTENIAKLIFEQIKWKFALGEFLEDYDIEGESIVEEINYILDEIF